MENFPATKSSTIDRLYCARFGPTHEGVHAMCVELLLCALDMFLYMSGGRFIQNLESQQHLSKKLKMGILGQKSELFY